MKRTLSRLTCALALCLGGAAQAGLVGFDPGSSVLVDIDPVTGATRYDEAGFRFDAPGVAFVPVDGLGTAGSDALLLLDGNGVDFSAVGGGLFRLLGLDFSGDLLVQAYVGSVPTLSEHLIGGPGLMSFSFSPAWAGLSRVSFWANADSVIDSVNAVPEPGALGLLAVSLAALAVTRRRDRFSGPQDR